MKFLTFLAALAVPVTVASADAVPAKPTKAHSVADMSWGRNGTMQRWLLPKLAKHGTK